MSLTTLKITMGWGTHLAFRTMSMIRGQLISLIYNKLTTLPITNIDESSAMTLMSTDVQKIAESLHYLIIDVLPNTTQLAIAVYLLYTNLGAVCVAPIIVTVGEWPPYHLRTPLFLTEATSRHCAFNRDGRTRDDETKAVV